MRIAERQRALPIATLAVVFAACSPGAATARVLEEVVVTAQKREQSLQEVPLSVSAYGADTIEALPIRNVGEILDFAPNVMRSSGPSSGDDGFFFFRGVGQVDNNTNVDPGVGVYIDEVYLGRIQGASFDVLDLDRIEILRGPQGTLFGRNTIGGAVSATTRDPGDALSWRGRLITGARDRVDLHLSADGPIAPGLGALLSGYMRNQDGWVRNVRTGARYGEREDIGGRVKLVWDASEVLQLRLSGDYARGRGSPVPTVLLGAAPIPFPLGPGGTPPVVPLPASPLLVPFPADFGTEIDVRPFNGQVFGSIPPDNDIDRGGVNFTVTWDTGPIDVKTITAYREADQDVHTDLDGTSYEFYDFFFGVGQDQFSQEIQLSGRLLDQRLHWLFGGYYFEEDVHNRTVACVGTGSAFPIPDPRFPPGFPVAGMAMRNDDRCLRFDSNMFVEVESWAVFGQLEFDFSERLTGVFGFRYTDESKNQSFDNSSDNTDGVFTVAMFDPDGPGPMLAGAALPGQQFFVVSPRPGSQSQILGSPHGFRDSWTDFSPKLGLNFRWTEQLMLYFSWSNGFKSGGVQGRATPGNPIDSFDPETIQTFELGVKSEWFDRRLRLNVAGFVSDYEDIQLLIAEVVNGTPQFNTRNAGSAEISGVELEAVARPVENLDLMFSLGWLNNEYSELDPGATVHGVDAGDSLPNAPEWTAHLGAEQRLPLGALGALRLRADWSYRSEHSFQAANYPGDVQEGYDVLNLRGTWTPPNRDYLSLAVFGQNVLDEQYYLTLSDVRTNLGVWNGVPAPGAEWGLEIAVRF